MPVLLPSGVSQLGHKELEGRAGARNLAKEGYSHTLAVRN